MGIETLQQLFTNLDIAYKRSSFIAWSVSSASGRPHNKMLKWRQWRFLSVRMTWGIRTRRAGKLYKARSRLAGCQPSCIEANFCKLDKVSLVLANTKQC